MNKIKLNEGELKIGTKEESLWNSVKLNIEARVKELERELIVNKEFLAVATNKVDLENVKSTK
jgi:hypothetical protein